MKTWRAPVPRRLDRLAISLRVLLVVVAIVITGCGTTIPPTASPDPAQPPTGTLWIENRGGPAFTVSINGAVVASVECNGGVALWPGYLGAPELPWAVSVTRRRDGAVLFSGPIASLPEWYAQIGDTELGPGSTAIQGPAGPSCPPEQAQATTPSVELASAGMVADAGTFAGGGLWAVRGQTMLVSTDQGATWASTALPVDLATLFPVWRFVMLDRQHAWLARYGPGMTGFDGSPEDVARYLVDATSDGGATWQTANVPGNYPGSVPALVFADARHGFLLAAATRLSLGTSTMLRTADGGRSWLEAGSAPWLDTLVSTSDATTVWSGGSEQAGGDFEEPILALSRNSGKTWGALELPGLDGTTEASCGCFLAAPALFTSASTGFVTAVNAFGSNGDYGTWVETTADAGRSWTMAAQRPGIEATGLAVLGDNHWLMSRVNPGGLDESVDGGASWATLASGGIWADAFPIRMEPLGGSTIAATVQGSGEPGPASMALLLSTDGGSTWRQLVPR